MLREFPGGYRLRTATTADSGSIAALIFDVLREHGLSPDPDGTDRDLRDVEAHYGTAGGWFGVVVEEATGAIVGTVGYLPRDAAGRDGDGDGEVDVELRKMYLHSRVRGSGIGRALLDVAMERARQAGYRGVFLETSTALPKALRLYEQNGFERLPEKPHACRCDVAMWRRLGP